VVASSPEEEITYNGDVEIKGDGMGTHRAGRPRKEDGCAPWDPVNTHIEKTSHAGTDYKGHERNSIRRQGIWGQGSTPWVEVIM